jgi:acetylornithine deacetylase/succinyl-diaminopimelate desuccinylase-like protein
MAEVAEEAVALLQRMLRHDTVNPPGNEGPLQRELAALLSDAGFEVQVLGRTEERPNVVARLRGAGEGPVLGFLAHVDTVLADAAEWQRDPWSGDLVDGVVWGRGAQDMKSQAAAAITAAVSRARTGWRPAGGDLLLILVVDEETDAAEGAVWLCEHHPEAVRCDYLVNEGAGTLTLLGDARMYGVCVGEKGVFRFALSTHGTGGHGSTPHLADNALVHTARLIERLGTVMPSLDPTEAPLAMLRTLGFDVNGDAAATLDEVRRTHPALADVVQPLLGVTFAPTVVSGSPKINVIPARARVEVDCRVPPGLGEEAVRRRLEEVVGPPARDIDYDLEWLQRTPGNASPLDTPLMDHISTWVRREDPGALVVPVVVAGYTDSRTWRDTFPDCVAYGFFPQRAMTQAQAWPLIHGKDERIHASDVAWATRCYGDLIDTVLG